MNFASLFIVLVSHLLSFTFAHADYAKHVKQLNGQNFNTEVIKNEVSKVLKVADLIL